MRTIVYAMFLDKAAEPCGFFLYREQIVDLNSALGIWLFDGLDVDYWPADDATGSQVGVVFAAFPVNGVFKQSAMVPLATLKNTPLAKAFSVAFASSPTINFYRMPDH